MEVLLIMFGSFIILGIFGTLNTIKSDTDKINKKLDQYLKSQKDAKQWKQ